MKTTSPGATPNDAPASAPGPLTCNLQPATAPAQPASGIGHQGSSIEHPSSGVLLTKEDTAPPSNSQLSTLNHGPVFERSPGETPRAFSAFKAFFDLGHSRSLQAVADLLGEKLDTIKKWSSRFGWAGRIHSFNAGLLQQAAAAEAARRSEAAADWARRSARYREHEWQTAQKLLAAIECFLDDFSDRDVEKMTLAQVSRAFQVASSIARSALSGSLAPDRPAMAPVQIELTAALKKAYGQPATTSPAPAGDSSTLVSAHSSISHVAAAHSPSPPLEERVGERRPL